MHPSGLFAGLSTLDLQYALPHFPGPNQKQRAEDFLFAAGGPAFNAAATFAFLGGEARLATVIGQHPLAAGLRQEAQRYHLKLTDLGPESTVPPPLSTILTTKSSGERSIVNTPKAAVELAVPEDWGAVPDIVLLDGAYPAAALALAGWARERGVPVVLDGGSWKEGTEALLPLLSVAICSADFRPPGYEGEVLDFLAARGLPLGAITRGDQPIRYFAAGTTAELPVPPVTTVDTLGAGDVFHGAFCFYFAQQSDFPAALAAAAHIAARSCQYLGAKTWMEFF